MDGTTTRRAVLGGTAAALAALAGCTSAARPTGDTTGTAVSGSFPVVTEFARRVAGDAASVSGLVPLGQHGHGWEPAATIGREVRESDVFVYVGEGFQPWADRLVLDLRESGADVATVAARDGVALRPAPGHDEHEDDDHDGHDEAHHGSVSAHEEHAEHEGDGEGHDDHDHRDESVDPHYWLDPTRAAVSVDAVATGLAAADPVNAGAYTANAEAYRASLRDLDATFESRLADRSRDAVLVAGHDAFQYLAERYGFEVYALSGIAPDSTPSPADVRRAQELIAHEGITHVLAPAFESDRAARQLVADTDAEGVLPVTSFAGMDPEWVQNGWGYREVMERVNLDSLATALGAD